MNPVRRSIRNTVRQVLVLVRLLPLVGCSVAPHAVFAETEKLGVVSYTPPAGWKKTPKDNIVAFSDVNKTTAGFCIITLYGATPSDGTPQGDFDREWKTLVVKPLQADANPKTETELAGGWTKVASGAAVEFQGTKAVAFLTVFSGFGKSVGVLAVFNDKSYTTQVQAFLDGISIDKTGPVAAIAVPPNAQSGKFGSMIYTPPPGWTVQVFQDGVVFKPSDLPKDEQLAVQVLNPLKFSGSLEQAFTRSYDEAAAMYKVAKMHAAGGAEFKSDGTQKSFHGWEYMRGKGGVQAENGTPYKTELGMELFVIKMNNRFERVAILDSRKTSNLSRYYSSDRLSYRNSIENLLYSLRFSDWSEPASEKGSAKGAGIVGVWQGISLSVGQTSVSEPLGAKLRVFYPVFFSNGQAYFGPRFPTEGLDALDTRVPPELHPRDWGTYTFSNGKGVLKMPYADIPMRMENNKFIVTPNKTDHGFQKLNSVDGATFDGTYVLRELNGTTPSITFTARGGFTDNGALKVLYHEYIDCLNPARSPGSGRYEVRDYSVIFHYGDGRRVKIAFLGVGYDKSNPSPAVLRMSSNDDEMKKQ
jgi:hypothetical protein